VGKHEGKPERKRRKERAPGRHRRPQPAPPVSDRCVSCDLGQHHGGRRVAGCRCYCASSG
jgi:hypothetical protein